MWKMWKCGNVEMWKCGNVKMREFLDIITFQTFQTI